LKFLGKLGQGLGLGLGIALSLDRGPTFDSISGYEDIKQLICRALHSEDSINILFWGEPASSKTMFLMELAKEKGAVYFDCTNTTTRILDILQQERHCKIISIGKVRRRYHDVGNSKDE